MGLCKPNIATSAKTEGSNTLRNGPFNACSDGIALFELLGLLALACSLNGLKLCLRTHHELTRIGAGSRTLAAAWTSQTILFAKLDTNHLRDRAILLERPFAAAFPLR